jgi:hypothetical protein
MTMLPDEAGGGQTELWAHLGFSSWNTTSGSWWKVQIQPTRKPLGFFREYPQRQLVDLSNAT